MWKLHQKLYPAFYYRIALFLMVEVDERELLLHTDKVSACKNACWSLLRPSRLVIKISRLVKIGGPQFPPRTNPTSLIKVSPNLASEGATSGKTSRNRGMVPTTHDSARASPSSRTALRNPCTCPPPPVHHQDPKCLTNSPSQSPNPTPSPPQPPPSPPSPTPPPSPPAAASTCSSSPKRTSAAIRARAPSGPVSVRATLRGGSSS